MTIPLDTAPRGWPRAPGNFLLSLLSPVAYLGSLALLLIEAVGSAVHFRSGRRRLVPALMRRLDELFRVGFPLVGLVHVGFGSFLSMQAYYGATFSAANGAVVGLGLLRNVAPMLTGFCLAAVLSVRISEEFSREAGLDDEQEQDGGEAGAPEVSRLVLVRLCSSAVAGPILILWGASVGTLIGALVSRVVLGVPVPFYFGMIQQMIRTADAVGVVVKGTCFGGLAALVACHEALRERPAPRPGSHPAPPALRATLLSMFCMLFFNFSWFNLVYMAGSPFGPGVAAEIGG